MSNKTDFNNRLNKFYHKIHITDELSSCVKHVQFLSEIGIENADVVRTDVKESLNACKCSRINLCSYAHMFQFPVHLTEGQQWTTKPAHVVSTNGTLQGSKGNNYKYEKH